MTRPGYAIVEAFARAYRRSDALLRRVEGWGRHVATGVLDESLSDDEKAYLSQRLYDHALDPTRVADGLFAWEKRWFARTLPDPPAHILVGGAGTGREVLALVALGHRVDALEPAVLAARRCRELAPGDSEVVTGSYEELSAAVLDGVDNSCARLSEQSYDAMLLGWGSLTHVLDPEDRLRLLRACARLAPQGPILASFWMRDDERRPNGRAATLGRTIGKAFARVRGVTPQSTGLSFVPWGGFSAPLTASELERLAGLLDRRLVWDDETGGFPRAAFVPERSGG